MLLSAICPRVSTRLPSIALSIWRIRKYISSAQVTDKTPSTKHAPWNLGKQLRTIEIVYGNQTFCVESTSKQSTRKGKRNHGPTGHRSRLSIFTLPGPRNSLSPRP